MDISTLTALVIIISVAVVANLVARWWERRERRRAWRYRVNLGKEQFVPDEWWR